MQLEKIGDEIWIANGPTVSFYGFPYPTRMALVRLDDDAEALRTGLRWLVPPPASE